MSPDDRTPSGVLTSPFLQAFSPDAAAARPGPKWLVERRVGAAEAFASMALPSESVEEWRYSRIDDLDLGRFVPPPAGGTPGAASGVVVGAASRADPSAVSGGPAARAGAMAVEAFLDAIGERGVLVRTEAGSVTEIVVDESASSLGVRVVRASELEHQPEMLGAVLGDRVDALTQLADAFFSDAVICTVPAGVRLDAPVVVIHDGGPGTEGVAWFPRTLVCLGEAAEASVVELVVSGEEQCLVVPVVELDLGDGAHLAYTSVQELGRRAWQLGYQASRIGRDAVLRSFVAALGGDYARQLTSSTLSGENGTSELLAVYLGDGSQVQDMRTFQEHVAPRTRSELVFKGAVADAARSVYTGLIHMHPGAKRSDAAQTNRNLVLSKDAHADSVPNLDIEENDVRCSHASAVGPIDEDQLFYLESRGVPPEVAQRLVLLGFFDDLLERALVPGIAAHLRSVVAARLAKSVLRSDGATAAR